MINPCSGCKDREVLCHSKCDRYKEFRKALDEKNETIRKAKSMDRLSMFKSRNKR